MADKTELEFWKALIDLLVKDLKKTKKDAKPNKQSPEDYLGAAIMRQRILPGASMIRKGRPMTDYLAKVKKKLRKSVRKEALKFRAKFVKGPQKALVTNNRKKARKAYHKS